MGMPGMGPVPLKRPALDTAKAGIPMFNPAAAAAGYQQLAYAPQQPAYVPVSCKYLKSRASQNSHQHFVLHPCIADLDDQVLTILYRRNSFFLDDL